MRHAILSVLLAGLAAGSAAAQDDEAGRAEYMIACAGCHGESGKGDGPLAGLLTVETPSLTTLAAENGTGWMVDGRNIIRAPGSKMPSWGERFQASATSERGETAEMVARGRILSLVYYIESIQEE